MAVSRRIRTSPSRARSALIAWRCSTLSTVIDTETSDVAIMSTLVWWFSKTSNTYYDWYVSKAYMIMASQAIVGPFLATFQEFPPRQRAASFTVDQAMEKLEAGLGAH